MISKIYIVLLKCRLKKNKKWLTWNHFHCIIKNFLFTFNLGFYLILFIKIVLTNILFLFSPLQWWPVCLKALSWKDTFSGSFLHFSGVCWFLESLWPWCDCHGSLNSTAWLWPANGWSDRKLHGKSWNPVYKRVPSKNGKSWFSVTWLKYFG